MFKGTMPHLMSMGSLFVGNKEAIESSLRPLQTFVAGAENIGSGRGNDLQRSLQTDVLNMMLSSFSCEPVIKVLNQEFDLPRFPT
jgi:hypothetical protein